MLYMPLDHRQADKGTGACAGRVLSCVSGETTWIPWLHRTVLCTAVRPEQRSTDHTAEHFLVCSCL